MIGDAPPFDVPAAFGRFRVLHQIGTGSLGPVFRGEDSLDGQAVAIKVLQTQLSPARVSEVAAGLEALAGRLPTDAVIARVIGAGVESDRPYVVSAFASGQALDLALRQFGPAAIVDALPRLSALAASLDLVSVSGMWHGGLHPRDILIDGDRTTLTGLGIARVLERAGVRLPVRRPYTPPEVLAGRRTSPEGDQYALAAIAFEWLFGRRARGPADSPVEVPALPGVARQALSDAFTRALAIDPTARFESCVQFVTAAGAAVRDAKAADGGREVRLDREPPSHSMPLFVAAEPQSPAAVADAPLEPPLVDAPLEPRLAGARVEPVAASTEPPPIVEPRADEGGRGLPLTPPAEPRAEPEPARGMVAPIAPRARLAPSYAAPSAGAVAWQGLGASGSPQIDRRAFGAGWLVAALLVGLVAGAGIGLTVGGRLPFALPFVPRAADRDAAATEVPESAGRGYTDGTLPSAPDRPSAPEGTAITEAPSPPSAPGDPAGADSARASREVTAAPELGRLLVRSSPEGAEVLVNGIGRGTTPVAVRDLPLGTHTVVLTRPGYARSEHRIALTATRPSRSLEARLVTTAAAAAPVQAPVGDRSTRVAEPRAATGTLLVESRPAGTRTLVNGRDVGVTPLTLDTMAPGVYTVRLEREGYRPWETSVRIVAGERARVAASLVGGTQQE